MTRSDRIFRGWNFDNDGKSDIPTNAKVVFLRFIDIENRNFEKVDAMLDPGLGTTAVERQVRGKVKYVSADKRMKIHLVHR
ncbi:MAG: hypothetical protein NPIRA01_23870 [Nitrospirales bacterium]|nr:MAG: hypothetical protein NPIRA01_23870 [Nitrospirales bacterium]